MKKSALGILFWVISTFSAWATILYPAPEVHSVHGHIYSSWGYYAVCAEEYKHRGCGGTVICFFPFLAANARSSGEPGIPHHGSDQACQRDKGLRKGLHYFLPSYSASSQSLDCNISTSTSWVVHPCQPLTLAESSGRKAAWHWYPFSLHVRDTQVHQRIYQAIPILGLPCQHNCVIGYT